MNVAQLFEASGFTLGMLALFNPCGFALFPAYIGYFLGVDGADEESNLLVALNRAQVVALSMALGFIAVFGIIGIALVTFFSTIAQILPWVTLVLGIGLFALGVAMLFGFQPILSLPKLQAGTGSRSMTSMFLFGVSYALASLTCTLALFLSVVGTSTSGDTFGERLGGFLSYSFGMALMAATVTLAVSFGKKGAVSLFRRILPVFNTISAIALVVVGPYLAWYGYWSSDPIGIPAGPVTWVERQQANFTTWIEGFLTPLGVVFLIVNVAIAVAGFIIRRTSVDRASETASV